MINPDKLIIENINIKLKFQFHIGMINPHSIDRIRQKSTNISIPHWYD